MPARQRLPDALRAVAMLSVLVVNAIGYAVAPWGPVLGERMPPGSVWAAATEGLVAAVLQGKGYAMLSFVFGMSLWLAARGHDRAAALRRGRQRQGRLLRLGVLHGLFVFFGDILTLYGLVGGWLLRRLHLPWAALRRHLWRALGLALLAKLAWLLAFVVLPGAPAAPVATGDEPTLSTVGGLWPFVQLNAVTYAFALPLSLLAAAPVVYLCMACGVAAARLRLLTHRRWHGWRRQWLRRAGPWLLASSAGYGWACAASGPWDAARPWIEAFGDLIAAPVAACYLLALALAARGGAARWCTRLAPLGRRTLTLYVGHSLLCMAVLSGAGAAVAATTVQTVAACGVLWLLALAAAQASGGRRWPLEAWLARR